MELKDLQIKQGKVDVTVDVVDVGDVREFEKFGKKGRVATAIVKDASRDMKLSLWNDDIDKIKAGDKIKIVNGYVSEWQGEPQLSTGKFGSIEVVGESDQAKQEQTAPPDEAADKKLYDEASKKAGPIDQPDVQEEDIKDE